LSSWQRRGRCGVPVRATRRKEKKCGERSTRHKRTEQSPALQYLGQGSKDLVYFFFVVHVEQAISFVKNKILEALKREALGILQVE